jgi:type IV pilus assembly protein PilM
MGQLVDDLLKEAQIPTNQAPIINVSVPAQAVVIRLMPVPVGMPPEELADVVTQEATNHVPFPISEANLDWCQMNATERTDPDGVRRVDVILSAIQHSIVESYWRMADVAGVKLGRVEVSSLSVIRGLSSSGLFRLIGPPFIGGKHPPRRHRHQYCAQRHAAFRPLNHSWSRGTD